MFSISATIRSRISSILLVVVLFAVLGGMSALAAQRPLLFGVADGLLIGLGVGFFEELYVQTHRGRWLRSMHPLQSMLCYAAFVTAVSIAALHVSHLLLWNLDDLPRVYHRLPIIIPIFLTFSFVGVSAIRIVHFTGIENLLHLLAGTYFRPVLESKVLVFFDMNGSTAISARLGAFETGSLVSTFIFEMCKPITDHGGQIYLYKGDGLIALWDWKRAVSRNAVLRAVDAAFAAVEREEAAYRRRFGVVPTFRVGIHGGEVVVSEQGDTKRGIGIYGEVINVAARMEEAARIHAVPCVLSEDMARAFDPAMDRFAPLGDETIRGLPAPVRICAYWPGRKDAPTQASLPGRVDFAERRRAGPQ